MWIAVIGIVIVIVVIGFLDGCNNMLVRVNEGHVPMTYLNLPFSVLGKGFFSSSEVTTMGADFFALFGFGLIGFFDGPAIGSVLIFGVGVALEDVVASTGVGFALSFPFPASFSSGFRPLLPSTNSAFTLVFSSFIFGPMSGVSVHRILPLPQG